MEQNDKPAVKTTGTLVKFDANADKTLIRRGLLVVQSLNLVGTAQDFYERGLVKYEAGEYVEAAALFRQAISLRSMFPEAHYHLGLALRWLGGTVEDVRQFDAGFQFTKERGPNVEQAITAFRTAIEQRRDGYPEAHLYLGLTLWPFAGNEGSELARSEIKMAISLRSDSFPEAHIILGLILLDSGKEEEARAEFRLAISQDPSLHWLEDDPHRRYQVWISSPQWSRASLLALGGEYEKAAAEWESVLAWGAKEDKWLSAVEAIAAHHHLGQSYLAMGNYPKAIAEFRTAIGLAAYAREDSSAQRLSLGMSYIGSGLFEEAINELQIAIEGSKADSWLAHFSLGFALWNINRKDKAAEEFGVALQQGCAQPEAGHARQCISDYLVTLKDVQRLISYGKRRGYLGRQEIKNLVPKIAKSTELMKVLLNILEVQEGVKVLANAGDDRTE